MIRSRSRILGGLMAGVALLAAGAAHADSIASLDNGTNVYASNYNNSTGTLSGNGTVGFQFLVPNNTGAGVANPIKANLTYSFTAAGTATVGLGGTIQQTLIGSFAITATGPPGPTSGNLLSSSTVTVLLSINQSGTATFQNISPFSYSSDFTFGPPGPASALNPFMNSFGFTLTGLTPLPVTIAGNGNLSSFTATSVGATFGGSTVPEPASLVLMGLGIAGIPAVRRLRRRTV